MERDSSACRLGPDTDPRAAVVDTIIEHGRHGIQVRQYVRPNRIEEGDLLHTHRRILNRWRKMDHEWDMIDHATGSMLQKLRAQLAGPVELKVSADLGEIRAQLRGLTQ